MGGGGAWMPPLYVRELRSNCKEQKLILCFDNPNLIVSNH